MASSRRIRCGRLAALAAATFAPLAAAHTGHGDAHGFLDGFMHPLLAPDHAMAMVAVGALVFAGGGRRRWLLPAGLIAVMTGLVAIIHGMAHGAGMPFARFIAHGSGFVVATAPLQAAGYAVAASVSALWSRPGRRLRTSRAVPGRSFPDP
jgi:urease accessory protein